MTLRMRVGQLLILALEGSSLSENSLDTFEECWREDPAGSQGTWAKQCCLPTPCGQSSCWAFPTFTYEFCCDVDACQPSLIEEVKSALNLALASLPMGPSNASVRAFRTAPRAFRAMLKLKAELSGDHQSCQCALAYAAAVLLWIAEGSPKMAAIQARWFVHHIHWRTVVKTGWGGIFGWLDRFPAFSASSPLTEVPDLGQRQKALMEVIEAEQAEAQKIWATLEDQDDQIPDFPSLLTALRKHGVFRRLWRQLEADLTWRKHGQKCVVLETDQLASWKCEPWKYHINASYASMLPRYHGVKDLGKSKVAVCVLGAPRTVIKTYSSIRHQLVEALKGDAFVYVPFQGIFTPALEDDLLELGPVVTAILVPDVNESVFEARVIDELKDRQLYGLYGEAEGPWRAPLHQQMGHSMWGYHNQHGCRRMVESYESQRGWKYEWIVFARAEMYWISKHPPLEVLDPTFVHIPWGQDNSNYDHNPLWGINDRHAVVPKRWFRAYFNRYQSILDGSAWRYLAKVAKAKYAMNTEQFLLLHLQAHQVPIRRFPPVAFLSHCTAGPQCKHLYKGTDLGQQRWTAPYKYYSEAIEVRRTTVDDVHKLGRLESGWIWTAVWPHTLSIWGSVQTAWDHGDCHELVSAEVVCGLNRHGPISSLRWIFFKRCECHSH